MSHRTRSLPPVSRLRSVIREIRYHESARQGLGILLAIVFSVLSQPRAPWLYAAAPVILAGIGVRVWASGHIKKNAVLATDGPYAYVRHPLYVGNILILSGFVIASGLWWTLIVALVFFLMFYPTAIEYEDRKLSGLFGSQWEQWRKETRALIPRLRPDRSAISEESSWSFTYSLKGNGEPIIALFLLCLLALIFYRLPT